MKCLFGQIALISLILIVSSAWAVEYDPDLMFFYPYEEIVGDTVKDVTGTGGPDGTGHHGTINGDITLVDEGKFGKAAKFAMNSFVDVHGEEIPDGEVPTTGFTICAWIKCENTGSDHGVFNARAADSTWLIHPDIRGGGQYRFCLRGDGDQDICDIKVAGVVWDEWIHYAGTYSKTDSEAILYINGDVIQNVGTASINVAGDWGLGARVGYNIDNERPFTGLMDDFSIWRRALTAEEVVNFMENGVEPLAVSPKDRLTTTWADLKQ